VSCLIIIADNFREKYLLGLHVCEKQNFCSYEGHDLPYIKKKKKYGMHTLYIINYYGMQYT